MLSHLFLFYFLLSDYYSQYTGNGIILKYFRNHKKPEIQKLAKKFLKGLTKKKHPVQLEGEIPSFQEIYNDQSSLRNVFVPITDKDLNNNANQVHKPKLKRSFIVKE